MPPREHRTLPPRTTDGGASARPLAARVFAGEQQHDSEFSTDNLANAIGISRLSCRKYLIYLAESGILGTCILYGATGR